MEKSATIDPVEMQAYKNPVEMEAHNGPVANQVEGSSVATQAHSVKDAAKACGISRTLLYKQIQLGRLRTVKIGRRRLVPRDALEALIAGGQK